MKKLLPFFLILIIVLVFFWQFLLKGLLPIPSDTIVGLYHPFRDFYAKDFPRGVPFKNFLITDPVRQQYPWRDLTISLEKNLELPLWNPYVFSGTPLLANFQSASFYPLNILFFVLPFNLAWSMLIFLEPLLAGIFIYIFLRNLKLEKLPSVFGSVAFIFCGFSIAWLEWGNILHTALWLPLILLSIDKILAKENNLKFKISNLKLLTWPLVYVFALMSSFFAGHLQIFFYLSIVTFCYFLMRWFQFGRNLKTLGVFFLLSFLFLLLTSFQWIPTLQFIGLSLRGIDQSWHDLGWFIPWQNLVQFLIPDFFGNPSTLNYWGVWNYGELTGYIGILPLIMAFFALFFRKSKETLFFGIFFFLSLIFALPTIFAKVPFFLNLPFISSAQPTRLLFITDFSLAVLSAIGFDYFLKNNKGIRYVLGFFILVFSLIWGFVLFSGGLNIVSLDNLLIAKRNLYLPTFLFVSCLALILIFKFYPKKFKFSNGVLILMPYALLLLLVFDLTRFGWKFTPFVGENYLFPQTKTIDFLQSKEGIFRIMASDSRIFPPNFSARYRLQSVDGYDPLYVSRYAELIAAYARGKGDINPPFGFNRIITPQVYDGRIIDLLGVKYILSVTNLESVSLKQVFQEGQTRVYENTAAFDRIFFVGNTIAVNDKQTAINAMFDFNYPLKQRAVVENADKEKLTKADWSIGKIKLLSYKANNISLETDNQGDGFLILTDTYYPTWHAKIDGKESKIYLTNFNFRGLVIPSGKHRIEFYNSLF
jgi:hypothetical protein